jgi:hypothetical protein
LSPGRRTDHERRARQVAGLGEAWVTYFEPEELQAKLVALGFAEIEDLGASADRLTLLSKPSRFSS